MVGVDNVVDDVTLDDAVDGDVAVEGAAVDDVVDVDDDDCGGGVSGDDNGERLPSS